MKQIGPIENSKNITNNRTKNISIIPIRLPVPISKHNPRAISTTAIAKLKTHNKLYHPYLAKSKTEKREENILTIPTRAVPRVGFVPVDENILLE